MLLLAIYILAVLRGMRITFGTWLISAVPAALCLGAWVVLAMLAGLAVLSAATTLIFNREEKEQLAAFVRDNLSRWRVLRVKMKTHRRSLESEIMTSQPEENI
jgi:hypothetical protein